MPKSVLRWEFASVYLVFTTLPPAAAVSIAICSLFLYLFSLGTGGDINSITLYLLL